ncbi:Glucose 1-dehydrogenase 2 [Pandoraea terrae]|uniref:Glucose 1-dehydrogenase 2 n=1 Tax=Pandoraea terrae TaxID=1537710 RepID=A0A5E4UX03_9BURK|nr:SDR family oxidoreductase [Pandoraea terrae]VVE04498.1 Glucose 1-dehydrogenase 2 [Pandoraea terrae]
MSLASSSGPAKLPGASSAPPRVALVTGAARRIGRAIALELAARGWDVAVHCETSLAQANETVAAIEALGRRAVVLQADLSDEGAAAGLIARCGAVLGLPACLVNNASRFEYDNAGNCSYSALDRHMRVNLGAPLVMAKALFQSLPAGGRGVVVNILDQKLANLNPDYLSYTLSKAALDTATLVLAQAFAPKLRVVGVAPGVTLASVDQTPEGFSAAHAGTPLGASSTPEDIAQAVAYLTDAPAVTGTVLYVDGGQHLVGSPRDVKFLTEPSAGSK